MLAATKSLNNTESPFLNFKVGQKGTVQVLGTEKTRGRVLVAFEQVGTSAGAVASHAALCS